MDNYMIHTFGLVQIPVAPIKRSQLVEYTKTVLEKYDCRHFHDPDTRVAPDAAQGLVDNFVRDRRPEPIKLRFRCEAPEIAHRIPQSVPWTYHGRLTGLPEHAKVRALVNFRGNLIVLYTWKHYTNMFLAADASVPDDLLQSFLDHPRDDSAVTISE